MRKIKTGEGGRRCERNEDRQKKREERRRRRRQLIKIFPVVRYPESYMYVIIFCVRLLSMEGSTGRQITRG